MEQNLLFMTLVHVHLFFRDTCTSFFVLLLSLCWSNLSEEQARIFTIVLPILSVILLLVGILRKVLYTYNIF